MQAERLARIAGNDRLTNARQLGTIAAIDVVVDDAGYLSDLAPRLAARFRDAGVLLRPLGNTIYVMPPYCIAADELDAVYAAITSAVHDS
jgi:adenosylmethionine-8-amino-7-oxononanoate aminotransferase